jgi:hypothetical protein
LSGSSSADGRSTMARASSIPFIHGACAVAPAPRLARVVGSTHAEVGPDDTHAWRRCRSGGTDPATGLRALAAAPGVAGAPGQPAVRARQPLGGSCVRVDDSPPHGGTRFSQALAAWQCSSLLLAEGLRYEGVIAAVAGTASTVYHACDERLVRPSPHLPIHPCRAT